MSWGRGDPEQKASSKQAFGVFSRGTDPPAPRRSGQPESVCDSRPPVESGRNLPHLPPAGLGCRPKTCAYCRAASTHEHQTWRQHDTSNRRDAARSEKFRRRRSHAKNRVGICQQKQLRTGSHHARRTGAGIWYKRCARISWEEQTGGGCHGAEVPHTAFSSYNVLI